MPQAATLSSAASIEDKLALAATVVVGLKSARLRLATKLAGLLSIEESRDESLARTQDTMGIVELVVEVEVAVVVLDVVVVPVSKSSRRPIVGPTIVLSRRLPIVEV